MLSFSRSLQLLSLAVLPIVSLLFVERHVAEPSETLIASRYHQRHHAAVGPGRAGFQGFRNSRSNDSNLYRQHYDQVKPVGPAFSSPRPMIATKPAAGVQS